MLRLALMLFPVVATTLMGIGVIAVLMIDIWATGQPIAWAALAGLLAAVPVSWFAAWRILALTGKRPGTPAA